MNLRGECGVCGKKIEKPRLYLQGKDWEHPEGSSWRDYHRVYKEFCSDECLKKQKKYASKELEELKKKLLAKDSEKFKRIKFMLKKNPVSLIEILITMPLIIMALRILIIFPLLGSIQENLLAKGIPLVGIIGLIFYISILIRRPWVIAWVP